MKVLHAELAAQAKKLAEENLPISDMETPLARTDAAAADVPPVE